MGGLLPWLGDYSPGWGTTPLVGGVLPSLGEYYLPWGRTPHYNLLNDYVINLLIYRNRDLILSEFRWLILHGGEESDGVFESAKVTRLRWGDIVDIEESGGPPPYPPTPLVTWNRLEGQQQRRGWRRPVWRIGIGSRAICRGRGSAARRPISPDSAPATPRRSPTRHCLQVKIKI